GAFRGPRSVRSPPDRGSWRWTEQSVHCRSSPSQVISPSRSRPPSPFSPGSFESGKPVVELQRPPAQPDPFPSRHRRALAELGADLELIHEATDARQAQPEAPGSGEAVLHGQRDVADPRPGVSGQDLDPALVV